MHGAVKTLALLQHRVPSIAAHASEVRLCLPPCLLLTQLTTGNRAEPLPACVRAGCVCRQTSACQR